MKGEFDREKQKRKDHEKSLRHKINIKMYDRNFSRKKEINRTYTCFEKHFTK